MADNKTAFGELQVAQMEPITQISAQYGTFANVFTAIDDGGSGSTAIIDGKYSCSTGTASDGLASVLTSRQLAYRPGQGALARFTSVFSTAAPNSLQAAGLITAENSFAFAYSGTTFGILYTHDGRSEAQELELTSPSVGAGNVSVTVNGIVYPIAVSGSGLESTDVYEIAEGLNAVVPNYTFTSNTTGSASTVIAQATIPGPQGAFAFSSGIGATGSWAQLVAGQSSIQEFIPKTEWNVNRSIVIDPTLGNVYQIQFQYLGFGAINFYVEKDDGDFELVHQLKYPNTSTTPSVTNPTFRIGWFANNFGNTTDITVQGSSAAGFIEGTIQDKGGYRSRGNNQTSVSALTNIISIRNRIHFGERINRAEILPAILDVATQANKPAFFVIVINPVFAGPMVWEYDEKENSITEYSNSKIGVSGGRAALTLTVSSNTSRDLVLEELESFLNPGDVLCVAAQVSSGAAGDMQASFSWDEEI